MNNRKFKYNACILEVTYGTSKGSGSMVIKCLWTLTKCKVFYCQTPFQVK